MNIRGSDVFLKTDLAGLLRSLALNIAPADVVDLVVVGDYAGRW